MPYELTKLTPNLVVSNVERSLVFYRDVLGFAADVTVPDQAPYVFAMAIDLGVPADRILIENQSTNTGENESAGRDP